MKNEKERPAIYYILLRYLILIFTAFPNLSLFYAVFTPLTIYPSYYLINLVINSNLAGNSIITSRGAIEIIDACVAGSAYYLLLILNLSTPGLEIGKRFYSIAFSFVTLLIINILRIFVFSTLFLQGFKFFNTTHLIFWYGASTIFVFLIWIAEIRIFNIKKIPLFSDIMSITEEIRKKT